MSSNSAEKDCRIVLHYLNDSRAQRILWLLEELQLPYTTKCYQRDPNTKQAPPELLQVHRLGKSPVITDGEFTLAESGAIVEYLLMKYGNGRFLPSEEGKMDNIYFTHYSEGSLMPPRVNHVIFTTIAANPPWVFRPIFRLIFDGLDKLLVMPELKRHAEYIEHHLSEKDREWFAGGAEPTAADFMMIFPLEVLHVQEPDLLGLNTKRYLERVQARPAYQRALNSGVVYSYAKIA